MRKNRIATLCLLPLLMTSCRGSSSPTALPNKGKNVSAEVGKTAFRQAYVKTVESEDNSDAYGVTTSGSYFHFSSNISQVALGQTIYSSTSELTVDELNLNFNVSGLTGTDPDLVLASAGAKATVAFNAESTNIAGVKTNSKLDKKTYEINGYVEKNTAYLDFSNSDIERLYYSLLGSFGSLFQGIGYAGPIGEDNSTTSTWDNKVKYPVGLTAEDMPLVSEENEKEYAEFEEHVINESSSGQFKDHGNGLYSYSYTLTGDQIDPDDFQYDSQYNDFGYHMNASSSSNLSYAVIFDENKGLRSIGLECKVALNHSSSSTKDSADSSTTQRTEVGKYNMNVNIEAGIKISFTKGKNVNIQKVADPENYVEKRR